MGRLIDVSDLNNQIMLNKDRFGCLSVTISNVFEDIIRDTPTVKDNEINIAALEKQALRDYLTGLKHEIYHELCKEIHRGEKCPCINQTTSCLAEFRVCDADRAIGRAIERKIKEGRVPCGISNPELEDTIKAIMNQHCIQVIQTIKDDIDVISVSTVKGQTETILTAHGMKQEIIKRLNIILTELKGENI